MLLAGITHPSKRDQWVFWLLDVDNNVCGRLTRSGIAQNRNCESFGNNILVSVKPQR